VKVLRIYHAGRDPSHRERERSLVRAGVDVTLVVPTAWPGADDLGEEPFRVLQLPVRRGGDVNRHRYEDAGAIAELVDQLRPDVVDAHEEPFSSVLHQVLRVLPGTVPVVGYTAQNLDKRFPPPFAQWERRALARLDGLYPCSRQAASVAVGKGFSGAVRVLPLGLDPAIAPGSQDLASDPVLRLLLVGRLVPEKGIRDAVQVLARLRGAGREARLTIVGSGPEEGPALALAAELGVREDVALHGWADAATLAAHYRTAHVLLAPSRSTRTWVEQFGRMVTEAQGSGVVVVGYASGSLPEVVGSAGVLVPEGDVRALADAVATLGREPARWSALRAAGLVGAAACDWDTIAAGQIELYEAAVAGGRGTRRVQPRRRAARAEYGAPAHVPGTERPFALPVLRDDTRVSRVLERAADGLVREAAEPARELRVVHLDHTAKLSGGEIALERLVAAGSSASAHVVLAEDGPLRQRLEAAGATVEVLPLSADARDVDRGAAVGLGGLRAGVAAAAYTLRVARRLRHLRPDVVHTNSLKAGYYGTVAARLARVPVVWHVRDRIADDYLPGPAVRLTRLLLRRLPDVVVANSRATAETTGVRAWVVADPYEASRLLAGARRTSATEGGASATVGGTSATEGDGDGSRYEIAVVGRISPWKGQDVVLRALASTPGLNARFVGSPMFGEDEYAARLRQLSAELGLEDRVVWIGFADDVEAHLADVDVVVHASTTPEPFGQVVVEAMAAGRPVVATRAGGPAEIITDGVDGLLTAPGDPADLARALEALRDPALRERLAAAALVRARDYAPERIAGEMAAVWRAAVRGRRTRR